MAATLAQGQTLSDLQGAPAIEAALPEQTPVQLALRFSVRPPGFDAAASALQGIMQSAGVQGAAVTADPFSPTLSVSWTKAAVGLPTILAVLAGGAAMVLLVSQLELDPLIVAAVLILAAILLVSWIFKDVAAVTGAVWTAVKPYAVLLGVVAVGGYALLEATDETPYRFSIRKHLAARYARFKSGG